MNAHPLQIARFDVVGSPPADGEAAGSPRNPLLQSLWSAWAADLGRFVCAMGMDANAADDVLQEVYLQAWRKSPPHADRHELRRWLFRVAANQCRLSHRRRGRRQRLLDAWRRLRPSDEAAPSAAQSAQQEEESLLVREALQRLSEGEREVLVLRYFQQFNATEIGAILELPPSTVRSRLRTARQTLADKLKKYGIDHDQ